MLRYLTLKLFAIMMNKTRLKLFLLYPCTHLSQENTE